MGFGFLAVVNSVCQLHNNTTRFSVDDSMLLANKLRYDELEESQELEYKGISNSPGVNKPSCDEECVAVNE